MDRQLGIAYALGLLLVGCGGGGNSDRQLFDGSGGPPISTRPLQGTIDNQPWSLVTAQTGSQPNPAYFWIEAYAESRSCGLSSKTTEPFVALPVPKAVGDYVLDEHLAANFALPRGDVFVSTTGRVRIDEITATTIRGGATIIYSAKHQVDGQFEARICP